jgi:hypothetical protein
MKKLSDTIKQSGHAGKLIDRNEALALIQWKPEGFGANDRWYNINAIYVDQYGQEQVRDSVEDLNNKETEEQARERFNKAVSEYEARKDSKARVAAYEKEKLWKMEQREAKSKSIYLKLQEAKASLTEIIESTASPDDIMNSKQVKDLVAKINLLETIRRPLLRQLW